MRFCWLPNVQLGNQQHIFDVLESAAICATRPNGARHYPFTG